MCSDKFPKTGVPLINRSTECPDKALMAGIDVITATESTKRKLTLDLTEAGSTGINIMPVIGIRKINNSSTVSVIEILYVDIL